jgi:hypothetical protein
MLIDGIFLGLPLDPKNGGNTLFRNVGGLSKYTALQPRIWQFAGKLIKIWQIKMNKAEIEYMYMFFIGLLAWRDPETKIITIDLKQLDRLYRVAWNSAKMCPKFKTLKYLLRASQIKYTSNPR